MTSSTATNPFATPAPWDAVASGYAAEAGFVMGAFTPRAIERSAPDADAVVLDVAAGPGTLSLDLAARVAEVHAIDFSEQMVRELNAAAHARGLANVHARVGDGQNLPYEDDRFAAAYSMFGLMFFPDRPRGFAELFRVLQPGGTAVVSSWAPVDASPLMQLMFGALAAADPERKQPEFDALSLQNPDVFRAELEAAGFVDVRVEPCTECMPRFDAEELWRRMVESSAPIVMLRSTLGDAEWQRQQGLALDYLREQLAREPELTTTAYLGSGRKPG